MALALYALIGRMDDEVEKQMDEIEKLQTAEGNDKPAGEGKNKPAGGEKSIDVETMKLERLNAKRNSIFDMGRKIIETYSDSTDKVNSDIGK
jgi:hypothetical protein